MYLFDFQRFLGAASSEDVKTFEDRMRSLMQDGDWRAACNLFADQVPVSAPALFSDDYFRSQAHYNMAMLAAHHGRPDKASALMAEAGTTSAGDWQDLMFSEHQRLASELGERQRQAIERGRPAILLASVPKAASAFLSQALSESLDVPVLRTSIGVFPQCAVVSTWAEALARGGCVTHDHLDGHAGNVERLRAAGIRRVFVQVRDPRAAMLSAFHFGNRFEPASIEHLFETFYLPALAWIDSWIDVQYSQAMEVRFIHFEQVRDRPAEVIGDICRASNIADADQVAADFVARQAGQERQSANFRSGDDEEWRKQIPADLQARLWDAIPPSVKALLCLLP